MQEQPPRGWWGRNWKWVVPIGCLGSLTIAVVLCAGIVGLALGGMKSSWACAEGLKLASHNKEVIQELGEPIEVGFLVSGSINVSGSSGEADLSIPLMGPRKKGTLSVLAHKRNGTWTFERAEVQIEGRQQKIDLLTSGKTPKG